MNLKICYEEDNVMKNILLVEVCGLLDGGESAKQELEAEFQEIARRNSMILVIDCDDCEGVLPEGLKLWEKMIEKHLPTQQFIYKPSQLMMCLKYDYGYTSKYVSHVFIDY